jgi:hypothetical protein
MFLQDMLNAEAVNGNRFISDANVISLRESCFIQFYLERLKFVAKVTDHKLCLGTERGVFFAAYVRVLGLCCGAT